MEKNKIEKDIIIFNDNSAYLKGTKAAVTFTDTDLFANPDLDPIPITINQKKYRGVVPWGEDNDLPQQILAKVDKSPIMGTNLLFNIQMGYGEGIVPVKINIDEDTGKKTMIPVYDNIEINEFFENNDMDNYLLEQLNDINYFYNLFPEIIFNKEKNRKIVSLISKEATFSRWEAMNDNGIIENHFYSAYWSESLSVNSKYVTATPVLNSKNTLLDLKSRLGLLPGTKDEKQYRYIIPLKFPTPGRFYYAKPSWYSLFESGWYDFAIQIPEFKKALMTNQMTLKYHIELDRNYFADIFADEAITGDKEKAARIKKEYTDLNKFLSSSTNTGKSVISYVKYSPDGKELRRMKITPLDNNFKGGEYIEDSEEVSNIMSYAMNVHPSLIGSSPGKNQAINGTEARELFNIKQTLLNPIRKKILRPLYIIKNINKWDPDIHFVIPNLILTTLDNDKTGIKEVVK